MKNNYARYIENFYSYIQKNQKFVFEIWDPRSVSHEESNLLQYDAL